MAITNDHAWLSTFNGEVSSVLFPLFFFALTNCCFFLQDEEMVSDPGQLVRQVLASHNVRIENREYF
jgi:hypothetical protein